MDNNIVVRKVNLNDNFDEIAELIYETDPYIYPYWFNNDVEEAKRVLVPLMKEDSFIFNYKFMYIAIDKNNNKIVGLVSIMDNKANYDYNYDSLRNVNERYKFTIDNYIMELINEVKSTGMPYLSNVSVHHDYRGKRIGTLLLRFVIDDIKDKYDKIVSDVLSQNPSAVKLYQNLLFDIPSPKVMGIGYGDKVGQYSIELDFRKNRK